MFCLFTVSLGFRKSLVTKFLLLNDEPCMVRPTLIDMNPKELKSYQFKISLNTCARSCFVFIPKNMCSKKNKRHKY